MKLVRQLDDGGTRELWLACEQMASGKSRNVVIKRLAHETPETAAELQNFAERVHRLEHRSVVKTFGWGKLDGRSVIVQEAVDGVSLDSLLSPRPILSAEETLWIARRIVRTLIETAPQLGRDDAPDGVHGALEAHRVLIARDGAVKLTGFDPSLMARSDVRAVANLIERAIGDDLGALATRCRDLAGLEALEALLDSTFYRDLDGDDEVHGESALAALVAHVAPLAPRGAPPTDETDPDDPRGEFTRALAARNAPVVPQPLTMQDRPTGLREGPPIAMSPRVSPAKPRPDRGEVDSTRPASAPSPWPQRMVWFTAGFVVAVLLMVGYLKLIGPDSNTAQARPAVIPTASSRVR